MFYHCSLTLLAFRLFYHCSLTPFLLALRLFYQGSLTLSFLALRLCYQGRLTLSLLALRLCYQGILTLFLLGLRMFNQSSLTLLLLALRLFYRGSLTLSVLAVRQFCLGSLTLYQLAARQPNHRGTMMFYFVAAAFGNKKSFISKGMWAWKIMTSWYNQTLSLSSSSLSCDTLKCLMTWPSDLHVELLLLVTSFISSYFLAFLTVSIQNIKYKSTFRWTKQKFYWHIYL